VATAGEPEGIDEVWHKHLCEAGLVAWFVHIQVGRSASLEEFNGFMARRRSFLSCADAAHRNIQSFQVWENVASVSSALERNLPSFSDTRCGMSSSFTHVTVVPTFTVSTGGSKVKLAILT
jgi:hypothetical protein